MRTPLSSTPKTRIAYIGSLLILAVVLVVGIMRTDFRRNDDGRTVRHTVREVQLLEQPGNWVLQINISNDQPVAAMYSVVMAYEGAMQSSDFWIEPGARAMFTRHLRRGGQMDIAMVVGPERRELDRFTLQIPEPATAPDQATASGGSERWGVFGSVARWFS